MFGIFRCIECNAMITDSDKYDLHQKRCDYHFLKWAKHHGLTKHWSLDDSVIDNFAIGGEWDRKREGRM